ncbi:glycoside hydrolase superfamily, partial [Hyaloraphidium curvatum]
RFDYLSRFSSKQSWTGSVAIFQSGSNHRYHAHDYFKVDPMLGGDASFLALLEAAHARGIKVVLDGVFNHASRGFLQFHDVAENGQHSPYRDWFITRDFPLAPYPCPSKLHTSPVDCNYACWWGLPALPKFNTDTPAVREFLYGVACHYIRLGIDGWRLDVPNEIADDSFWQEFRTCVKALNPEAYIVGEIWDDATRWLQGDQFDATMNYAFTRFCLGCFGKETLDEDSLKGTGMGVVKRYKSGMQALGDLDAELDRYDWNITQVQLNLLGSHDTPRFLTCVQGDASAYSLSVLLGVSLPGAFCVYYGDEVGMEGGRDPDCRRSMIWDDKSLWDEEQLAFVKRMLAIRHAHPVLRRGRFKPLCGDMHHLAFAFERRIQRGEDKRFEPATAIVVMNADHRQVDVHLEECEPGTYFDLVGGTGPVGEGAIQVVVEEFFVI